MKYRRFYYRVVLRCEFGPEPGSRLVGRCAVVSGNSVTARRTIVEFVSDQNRPPHPEGIELNPDERRHVHENWPRWVVESIDVTDPFDAPEGQDVFWTDWLELPPPVGAE